MSDVDPLISHLYSFFDLTGVLLYGIIGGTIARHRQFDLVGFTFLALFTALGGGMVRDSLMQTGTAAAIEQPAYLILAVTGAVISLLIYLKGKPWELFKVHADAVVMGVWAVTGATKALNYGMPVQSAVFLGVLTAVGGGMIRDVAIGEIPSIFGGGTLYAVPATVSATTMVVFHSFDAFALGMIIAPFLGAGLAIASYWRGWILIHDTEWAPVNSTARRIRTRLRDRKPPQPTDLREPPDSSDS